LPAQLVIFDFDGTILDSMQFILNETNRALTKRGLGQIGPDLLARMAGHKLSDILKAEMKIPHRVLEEVEKEVFESYMNCHGECSLFPNTKRTLRHLRLNGAKLALLTTTPKAAVNHHIDRLDLRDFFDIILAREDISKCKPNPEGILQIARTMETKTTDCVYVGDSPADIAAGRAAGTKTVGVLTGLSSREQLRKEKPDLLVNSISDLVSMSLGQ